jgi:hypothetical protein
MRWSGLAILDSTSPERGRFSKNENGEDMGVLLGSGNGLNRSGAAYTSGVFQEAELKLKFGFLRKGHIGIRIPDLFGFKDYFNSVEMLSAEDCRHPSRGVVRQSDFVKIIANQGIPSLSELRLLHHH